MNRKTEGGYVWVCAIILLIICTQLKGQVFFNSSKVFYSETDALFVPMIQFSYGLKEYEFIEKNTGLSVDRKYIHPGIYFGGMLLTDGWAIGLHFDPFNLSGMMAAGCNIPVRLGKKKKINN